MADFTIRPIRDQDRAWVARFTQVHWGSNLMITHGLSIYISQQPGFIAEQDGQVVGLVTYHVYGVDCEVTSLNSLREGQGIGTALIAAVSAAARAQGSRRLFLITSNDNLNALGFYQKRGFRLCALRPGAINESRKIKPEIPLIGSDGIPIRDELELEMSL